MSKMYIMVGLPASGKTTKSFELMKYGNTVRINKDSLRTMLHNDVFNGRNEGMTRDASRTLAKAFLAQDINVIIDDTNLNEGTLQSWKDLGMEAGAKVEIVDLTDVPVEECVFRDGQRQKSVGNTVIKNMALQYGIQPQPVKGYCIFDIDGTISDPGHRRHYVQQTPKDWKGFFSHMNEDTLRKEVASLAIDYYNKGHQIIYVSARPDDYREVTLKWLNDHNMSFGWTLIMRKSGDKRPDTEVKQEIYDRYLKKYPIEVVVDDRPVVIKMWEGNGLKVIDVGDGVDF